MWSATSSSSAALSKMQELHPTSNLIHGCEIISGGLRLHLSPMGTLFEFDGQATGRPRPLTLWKVLSLFLSVVIQLAVIFYTLARIVRLYRGDERMIAISSSEFLNILYKLFSIFRTIMYLSVGIIIVAQHCSIASVIANRNYIIKEEQQARIARTAFAIILSKNLVSVGSLMAVVADYLQYSGREMYVCLLGLLSMFALNLTASAPIIYTCYLGASLGKHVENFSKIYIDTMFDQYMNAIETERDPEAERLAAALRQTAGGGGDGDSGQRKGKRSSWLWFCCGFGCCGPMLASVRWLLTTLYLKIRAVALHLNARKYPELPEMKMTKLSSTTSIKISDAARAANSHLIRARLRRTQIMLSELRDMVNDINKMSSPIVMMQFIMDTMIIIFVATASIQAKVYKSINVLIIPTVAYTTVALINVVFVCTCLDETSSQLKLMTNKLFDFIIMNQRVQQQQQSPPQGGKSLIASGSSSSSDSVEEEALSETWSQFQYTRKLSNTIQFTMGGILNVTRRLALPILGNILSAVFISIEVMSIIDTSSHQQSTTTSSGLAAGRGGASSGVGAANHQ